MVKGWDYKGAGVDIETQDRFINQIKREVATTHNSCVLGDIGGFGGLYHLKGFKDPVLVASTDGVGTKLLIAQELKRHTTIGQDLVAMCVNDILVQGAKPLFFMDYLATGRLDREEAQEVLLGIVDGCKKASCPLLGGETAEMPGFYPPGRYDLAGFALGVVEREKVITGEEIEAGDSLVGLLSNGLHSNGYSLVRKVFLEEEHLSLREPLEGLGCSLGDELLRPTHIYVPFILPLLEQGLIKGMAHITGGGITGNLKRVLPHACKAVIQTDSWHYPVIFQILKDRGHIATEEMFATFNMGIGFILVVAPNKKEDVMAQLSSMGEEAYLIGEVQSGKKEVYLQ